MTSQHELSAPKSQASASRSPDDAFVVELFSPVLPMRTGPATYFDKVARRLARLPGCREAVRIAIDPDFVPLDQPVPTMLHGIPVASHDTFTTEVPTGCTRVLFLANNDHHAYAVAALARQSSRAMGRTICVLHDPSAFMINRFMTGNGRHRQTEADLAAAIASQYGRATEGLLSAHLDGKMPDIFEYVTHAQHLALSKADEIWVHSLFGLVKLVCETDMSEHRLPKIVVCAHPRTDVEAGDQEVAPAGAAASKFRIGVFGWVTAPKRVNSVIRGLSLALDRLGPGAAARLELLVVGRRPSDTTYDPAGEARRFNVADITQFVDYPDEATFERLQTSCQMIFNLRFPSVGETSGTLVSAEKSGARIVMSRYGAFHEHASEGRQISMLPHVEDWQIASEICEAMADRQADRPLSTGTTRTGIASVESLLALEIYRRRAARGVS